MIRDYVEWLQRRFVGLGDEKVDFLKQSAFSIEEHACHTVEETSSGAGASLLQILTAISCKSPLSAIAAAVLSRDCSSASFRARVTSAKDLEHGHELGELAYLDTIRSTCRNKQPTVKSPVA